MSMDGGNLGLIYGLEFQCRALAPVEADTDNVRFLVGTQGLKITNQILELELDEDTRTVSKRICVKTKSFLYAYFSRCSISMLDMLF